MAAHNDAATQRRCIITLHGGDKITCSLGTPEEVRNVIHDTVAGAELWFKRELRREEKKRSQAFQAKLRGYPLMPSNEGTAVVAELYDRLGREGWRVSQVWGGVGVSLLVDGRSTKLEREAFRRSHSIVLALHRDFVYASGLDGTQMTNLELGLTAHGMTIQRSFRPRNSGVFRCKIRGYPFVGGNRQPTHCIPAVLSILGEQGFHIAAVARPYVIAFVPPGKGDCDRPSITPAPCTNWGGVSLISDLATVSSNLAASAPNLVELLEYNNCAVKKEMPASGRHYDTVQVKVRKYPFRPPYVTTPAAILAGEVATSPNIDRFVMADGGGMVLVAAPDKGASDHLFGDNGTFDPQRPADKALVLFMVKDTCHVSLNASENTVDSIQGWFEAAGLTLQKRKRYAQTHELKFRGWPFLLNVQQNTRLAIDRAAREAGLVPYHSDRRWVVGSGDSEEIIRGFSILLLRSPSFSEPASLTTLGDPDAAVDAQDAHAHDAQAHDAQAHDAQAHDAHAHDAHAHDAHAHDAQADPADVADPSIDTPS